MALTIYRATQSDYKKKYPPSPPPCSPTPLPCPLLPILLFHTLMPSIRKPRVEVEDVDSLHCMYRGLVMACRACSSSVGSLGSTATIFSYISCVGGGTSHRTVSEIGHTHPHHKLAPPTSQEARMAEDGHTVCYCFA